MLKSNKRDLYTIPDLPLKEIIDYYAEIQVQVRPNDILKPTPMTTLKLFDALLELYKGEKTADIVAKHNTGEDAAEFDEALYAASVYQRAAEFLRRIGIQSFALKNIMQPETKKLIGILSAVVNFSMYRDNKRDLYERISAAISEREAMRGEIVGKIKKAEAALKRLESEAAENERMGKDLEDEVAQLEGELRELYRVHRARGGEVEKTKEEKTGHGDRLCSLQLLALNLKQEIARLKTQVVSDPEKLLELLAEMRSMIAKERESLRVLQKRKTGLGAKAEEFAAAIVKMKRLNITAVLSQSGDKEIERLQRESQEMEAQIKNDETAISSLKIKLGHVNRQIAHLESKVASLQDNDKRSAHEIAGQLESLKLNYEKISDERSVISGRALENMRECKHIEFEIFKLRSAEERDLTDIRGRLCELKDHVLRYTGALRPYLS